MWGFSCADRGTDGSPVRNAVVIGGALGCVMIESCPSQGMETTSASVRRWAQQLGEIKVADVAPQSHFHHSVITLLVLSRSSWALINKEVELASSLKERCDFFHENAVDKFHHKMQDAGRLSASVRVA